MKWFLASLNQRYKGKIKMNKEVKTQPQANQPDDSVFANQPDDSKLSETDLYTVSIHWIGRLCKFYTLPLRVF